MARETEIKLKITDQEALQRALTRLGAHLADPRRSRIHEENMIFDTPESRLANRGQLLRIRTETLDPQGDSHPQGPVNRFVLTFKQPIPDPSGRAAETRFESYYKVRDETELDVADGPKLASIFEHLGMPGWFRYEKYRTTFQLPDSNTWAKGLLIEIDETPIGTFLELEGPTAAIDRAAEELGFSKHDYVLLNYLTLYLEECRRKGEQPGHMLFSSRTKPSK
jgi:adenylate cyclase class 2